MRKVDMSEDAAPPKVYFDVSTLNLLSVEQVRKTGENFDSFQKGLWDVCRQIENRGYLGDTSVLEGKFNELKTDAEKIAQAASLIRKIQHSAATSALPDLNGALNICEEGVPENIDTVLQKTATKGYDYFAGGDFPKAHLITILLGRLAKTEAYYHLSAVLLMRQDSLEEVDSVLKAGCKQYPKSCLLAIQRANFFQKRLEWKKILSFVTSFQNAYGAHYGLAFRQAKAFLAIGRYAEVLTTLEPYLIQNAPVPPDQRLYFQILYGLGLRKIGDGLAAKRQLKEVYMAGLENAGLHLANLLTELEEYDAAMALYKELSGGSFMLYAQMGMARVFRRIGREPEAEETVRKSLENERDLLIALCRYVHLKSIRQTPLQELYAKVVTRTALMDALGDSLRYDNGLLWRLWPEGGKQAR